MPTITMLLIKVVSAEVSENFWRKIFGEKFPGGKFPSENLRKFIPIFLEISGSLLKNFFTFYILIITVCIYCKISTFLTNNSPDLHALASCIMFRKNNLLLAQLPRISANSNENYRRYKFQGFVNISGNFRNISRNIKFPENSQPYCWFPCLDEPSSYVIHCYRTPKWLPFGHYEQDQPHNSSLWSYKAARKSLQNFLCNPVHGQTNRQTDKQTMITEPPGQRQQEFSSMLVS